MPAARANIASLLIAFVCIGFAFSSTGAAQSHEPAVWKRQAYELAVGDSITIEKVARPDSARVSESLILTRFSVMAPGAGLRIDGKSRGPLREHTQRTYLAGEVIGQPGSRVTVILDARGQVRGLARFGGNLLALTESPSGLLAMSPVSMDDNQSFACGNDNLVMPEGITTSGPDDKSSMHAGGVPPEGYLARIAIETDHEYYQKFDNTQDATDYAMDLVAFSSTIYSDEVDTALAISDLSLWTSPGDPWTQTGTGCLMYEFGRYWNDNNDGIDRTIAHLLSGRSNNSGIAWVGVLCSGGFPVNIEGSGCSLSPDFDDYGGAYGVTSGLDADFDLQNPQGVWDIIAFAHEVGHNFDSPHTHCYNGLGGHPDPIDQCYNGQAGAGCYSGTQQLPGPAGQGSGTLMSYCHLLSPGLSNIALNLGTGHPHGVMPERVPERMFTHVMNRASVFPECLAIPDNDLIYADGFETAAVN